MAVPASPWITSLHRAEIELGTPSLFSLPVSCARTYRMDSIHRRTPDEWLTTDGWQTTGNGNKLVEERTAVKRGRLGPTVNESTGAVDGRASERMRSGL
jgi:hypothetical protein